MHHHRRIARAATLLAALGLFLTRAEAQVRIGPPIRVDTKAGGAPCNETSMGASQADPLVWVAAWNDYRMGNNARVGLGLSFDAGVTWSDRLLRPPPDHRGMIEGDPMTAYDQRTGTLWAGGMSFTGNGGIFVARKDVGASDFQAPVMARLSPTIDKGWMTAGPDPADPTGSTLLYVAYNQGLIRSTDMGATWSAPQNLGNGLGFLPRCGPNGELYIAFWNTNDKVRVRRSFDGGLTLSTPTIAATRMDVWGLNGSRFPGNYRVPAFAGFAVDPNSGELFLVYPDTTDQMGGNRNVDLYFTNSQDHGVTWSTPRVINADGTPPGDQFFPWLEVDAAGRLHMVFNDTRLVDQDDNAGVGWIDVYYSYSDDQGATWTEARLTPNSWSSATDGFAGRFIGDYIGMANAGGRTLPFYMSTEPDGNADVFTHVVTDGPTSYCYGLRCPCGNDDPVAGCGNAGVDGAVDSGVRLDASGSTQVAADDLVLRAEGILPGGSALLFAGTERVDAPFGDGRRCVGGRTFRYPPRVASAAGSVDYGPGELVLLSHAFAPPGRVQPGATFHYQLWYRDPSGPCGSGFGTSNALSVAWE